MFGIYLWTAVMAEQAETDVPSTVLNEGNGSTEIEKDSDSSAAASPAKKADKSSKGTLHVK